MALPTVSQLQQCGFAVRLVGRGWAKDLLSGLNLPVTAVPKGIVAAGRGLRMLGASRGVLFTNSLSTAISMRLAGISAVGYRADWRGPLLHVSLVKSSGCHEVEYFWKLGAAAAACWGEEPAAWPDSPPERLSLPLVNTHRLAAARALALAHVHGSYMVACPMAAGTTRGRSKEWPHFDDWLRVMASQRRRVVICPGPGEEDRCLPFARTATVLPGLSLGTYAAVMAGADAVVANDSGPMHMAAAVGAPVLGVFGHGNPMRTRPWGGHFVGGMNGWPTLDAVLAAFDEMLQPLPAVPAAAAPFFALPAARETRAA